MYPLAVKCSLGLKSEYDGEAQREVLRLLFKNIKFVQVMVDRGSGRPLQAVGPRPGRPSESHTLPPPFRPNHFYIPQSFATSPRLSRFWLFYSRSLTPLPLTVRCLLTKPKPLHLLASKNMFSAWQNMPNFHKLWGNTLWLSKWSISNTMMTKDFTSKIGVNGQQVFFTG